MAFNIPADSLTARLAPIQQALTAGALPSPIVPFGEWMPDRAELGNPGGVEAKNVLPFADGYRPFPGMTVITDALTARPQGLSGGKDSDGNVTVVAGDATKLYKLVGTTFNDASNGTYTIAQDGTWEFADWGNSLIATNFDDAVQVMDKTGSTFADMITSTNKPKARHIGIIRDFVVLGNTNDSGDGNKPSRVWWSGINDNLDFDPAASTQSDYQDLPSGGWVQAIAPGENFGLVLSENNIRRMSYVGSPRIFRFDIIDEDRGCRIPNSAITVGKYTYFYSDEGWFRTDGNSSQPIGHNKVDKWFKDQFDFQYESRVSTAVDPINKLILWGFPGTGSNSGIPNIILAFNYIEHKWSHIDLTHERLAKTFNQGYTLDGLDAIGTDIDSAVLFPFSLDSRAWTGGELKIGAFDTDFKLNHFTASNLEATLDTGVFQPNNSGLADLTGVTPLVAGDTSITCSIAATQRLGNTFTFGTAVGINSFGKANFAVNGQYFKSRTIIAAAESWTTAQGVQVDASATGNP